MSQLKSNIKFRAWTGKEMYYQETQYLASFIRRAVGQIDIAHGGNGMQHESYLPNGGDIEEYLMQYTGIIDMDGIEIYEGDIIEWTDGIRKEIVFQNGGFMPKPEHNQRAVMVLGIYDNIKIIGNIYQNKDLLK